MLAWILLGLLVVVVVGVVLRDRQNETYIRLLDSKIDERPEPEGIELNEAQKRDLSVAWGQLVCSSCGMVHPGLCPRVREVRYQANGNFERIIFWNEGQWTPQRGTISAWDVFGNPTPPVEGETK